jgi:O-acetyl-ADP-ribose deacetylase (regulator of RNase III)
MIEYRKGDLLKSGADALVNTVNTEGIMGKGIALQIKRNYPSVFKSYQAAAKRGEIQVGKVQVVATNQLGAPRFILNFPTKKSWRHSSQLMYIHEGLPALVAALKEHGIKSVAIPPLGAGNGGLDWALVKPLISNAFASVEGIQVIVYEPSGIEYVAEVKTTHWTSFQLQLAAALFDYAALGDSLTQIEIQKLAYFLQRAGGNFDLRFIPNRYGPYSDSLRHVVSGLEGKLFTGLRAGKARAFDELSFVASSYLVVISQLNEQPEEERRPWQNVQKLIYGWESPYGLELLATLDWILQDNPGLKRDQLLEAVSAWGGTAKPDWGRRKAAQMKPEHLKLAFEHLKEHQVYLPNRIVD